MIRKFSMAQRITADKRLRYASPKPSPFRMEIANLLEETIL